MKLGIFGQKEHRTTKWLKLGKDSFLFPQVLDIDRGMWGFLISFHLAIAVLFIGHLRLIFEFTALAKALGDLGMEQFAFLIGGAIGIILLITVFYFLIRRLTLPGKKISAPEDYFLLILLLLVIFTGNYMRFFGDIPITAYRQYVNSLLSFNPYIPTALDTSVARWSLGIHVMFANMLIFYLPFSKLMHFVGSFATNRIRREYLWVNSYKRL
ncbi:MAG: respiratory nitrate reductase subunit gamma [Desulfobacterales bacterium]|nr:MAG: respiratory nitrate reductase subunit gamma [Desulfobacterales bacterium]